MKVLAVIPARAHSKGIKDKNILSVGGKPLIVWTIEAAKECKYIDRIIVSSDGRKILEVAEKYGAERLKRPVSIAGDGARSEPVVAHVLQTLSKGKYMPDLIVYLQPTSPLRTTDHLNKAFELFNSEKADALISVVEVDNKVLKAFIKDTNGFINGISNNHFPFMNRQHLPSVYMPNGAIYIVKANKFLKSPRFWTQRTIPFVMSTEHSIDIDTPEDIVLIEKIILRKSL